MTMAIMGVAAGSLAARPVGPLPLATASTERAQTSQMRPLSLSDRGAIGAPMREVRAAQNDELTVLSEDFSKCTNGSETKPDAEGIQGEIPATLTHKSGWAGATFRQAGGCAFLDTCKMDYQGQQIAAFYLDAPWLQLKENQTTLEITFRARTIKQKGDDIYLVHANVSTGKTINSQGVKITNKWADYTIYVDDCTPESFVEFQADSSPFYIDDIRISVVPGLATPKVLPATDITPAGFTANWGAVDLATGYLLNPKAIHISNGLDPRYLIDADFESITEGTIKNPVPPQYSVYSLNEYIPQKGWLVRLPYFAKGCLGLSNQLMESYGNSLLQSPTLNLSASEGRVNVKMRYLAQDVDMFQVCLYSVYPDGRVSLRSTKMVYTQEVYDKWIDEEFTISGGTTASMLVILLPETTKGTIFFDNLQMWQILDAGTRYSEPMEQFVANGTSLHVATPDAAENDTFSYSVTAYRTLPSGKNIYSDPSDEIMVGSETSEQPESLDAPKPATKAVQGGRFTATWDAVKGANAYRVDVYRRHNSNGFETFDVINEKFDGIKVGTTDLDHPRAMSEDGYDRLDAYTKQPGWEVFQGFYVDGAVGILGYWNMLGVGCYMRSPEFDLSANEGKMTMEVKVGSDYYNQGATIYLCHENKETGALVYDEMFPMDEMEKGFHNFTHQFTKGRNDSFFVFYPYGYGLSYFDDIRVSQQLPAGVSDIRLSTGTTGSTSITLTVPDVVEGDEYFYTVTALWIDSADILKVESKPSEMMRIEGLVATTTFSGKVTDKDGNAVAGATVRLVNNANPKDVVSATANRWGLFRVENIADFKAEYTPVASAPGFLTAMAAGATFTDGTPVEGVEFKLREAADMEKEAGLPTKYSSAGPLYLQYGNSDSETIYPADAIDLPAGTKITSVSYDGYCDTEKDVNYRMELYLQNCDESGYTDPTPSDASAMTLFDSGTRQIAMTGDALLPAELVRFENKAGFEYKGGNLRVLARSRSNKSNSIFFLMDVTRPSSSIYRYWSGTESKEWRINQNGMPVIRLGFDAPEGIPGIADDLSNGVKARGLEGAIEFEADTDCAVKVYTPSGVCVAVVALQKGRTVVDGFTPGLYLIPSSKVIVK